MAALDRRRPPQHEPLGVDGRLFLEEHGDRRRVADDDVAEHDRAPRAGRLDPEPFRRADGHVLDPRVRAGDANHGIGRRHGRRYEMGRLGARAEEVDALGELDHLVVGPRGDGDHRARGRTRDGFGDGGEGRALAAVTTGASRAHVDDRRARRQVHRETSGRRTLRADPFAAGPTGEVRLVLGASRPPRLGPRLADRDAVLFDFAPPVRARGEDGERRRLGRGDRHDGGVGPRVHGGFRRGIRDVVAAASDHGEREEHQTADLHTHPRIVPGAGPARTAPSDRAAPPRERHDATCWGDSGGEGRRGRDTTRRSLRGFRIRCSSRRNRETRTAPGRCRPSHRLRAASIGIRRW